jgi:hypothetical protein
MTQNDSLKLNAPDLSNKEMISANFCTEMIELIKRNRLGVKRDPM